MRNLEKEIRYLQVYALLLTVVCAVLFVFLFKITGSTRFEEINVERINIIEKDGKLRLVISNKQRQHPGIVDGIIFEERKGMRPPGLMFFNEKGDELGGLVFDGNTDKGQGGSFTFDKFRGDQTIQLIHEEDEVGNYFAGLKMSDQNMSLPDLLAQKKAIDALDSKEAKDLAWQNLKAQGLLMTERLRIGKEIDKSSVIRMKDAKGQIRIELKVEDKGNPNLTFFNEFGKAIYSLPPRVIQ